MRRLRTTWVLLISAAVTMALAAYLFLSAIATASLRFGYCGPTSLEHAQPACRVGTKLLLVSYGVGGLALALALMAIWIHWRRYQCSKIPIKPKPAEVR